MNTEAVLDEGLGALGVPLDPEKQRRLLAFASMVERWNRTFNLTSIRDPRRIMTHHLLDSVAVLPHLPSGSLADIGAGGGFPGIPVAIAQPERPVTLVDSNSKKTAFLRQVAIELALPNMFVHEGRVEDWKPKNGFDVLIARAFASLAGFVGATRHLLSEAGEWVAMKGALPEAEIAELGTDIEVASFIRLDVPYLGAERHLIRLRRRST